ncbi:odorant receptor 22c-like [Diachasma alloeum]|uniref:Odorant receptor n=1 Tax=Diachasma alloeum TaxID=454923 RepID=A0A4E0RZ76_9HYME|nr:odorant receptor 22c-like [Diachasma alloeum]THK33251.1 odorant receptor 19 [Diachasma alloeum]
MTKTEEKSQVDRTVYENEDFNYAIGWNRFSLDVLGAWPRRNSGIIGRQRSLVCALGIIILIYLPQSASVVVHWGNMDAVIECLSVNGPVFLAFAKLLLFRYRRKEIRMLIDFMSDDWNTPRSLEEREAMLRTAKMSRVISLGSGVITHTLFVAYIFYKIYFGIEDMKRTDLDPRLAVGLLHPARLPFDTRKIEYFIPMWIGQCFCTYFSMTIYAVFDCMISAVVLHICGQFSVIGLALRNLADDQVGCRSDLFREKLAAIVKRHEKLNDSIGVIEDSFSSILLPQMLICTFTFCFQGFALITSLLGSSTGKITFLETAFSVTYVFYTVLHLFVYCYIGDQLLVESSSISYSVYDSHWYNLPARHARSLLFVGYRSLRPLKITAGKYCGFSRNLFIIVLKTSMGYLSMLLTVKQRMTD